MPCAITNSGSYILTENVSVAGSSNGITIAAGDILLDLNGFAVVGATGTLNGILIAGSRTNIVIRNGIVRGWGQHGVEAMSGVNVLIRGLLASGNGGCGLRVGAGGSLFEVKAFGNLGSGMDADVGCNFWGCTARSNTLHGVVSRGGSTVTACAFRENGGDGFRGSNTCVVVDCNSRDNGGAGICVGPGSSVTRCALYRNRDGVATEGAALVADCVAYNNSGHGFNVAAGSVVRGCSAHYNSDDGIRATNDCAVLGNTSWTNTTGIRVTGKDVRVENNHLVANEFGLVVLSNNNFIVRNTATHNAGSDYTVAAGNNYQTATNPGNRFPTNAWLNFKF
jgi:hypothetical protein